MRKSLSEIEQLAGALLDDLREVRALMEEEAGAFEAMGRFSRKIEEMHLLYEELVKMYKVHSDF